MCKRNWGTNNTKALLGMLLMMAFFFVMPVFAADMDASAYAPCALAQDNGGNESVLLGSEVMPKDSAMDGTKIMGIKLEWLTEDSHYNNEGQLVTTSPARLFLATDSNSELAMTFQIEVELSGQYDYKPGDIRITIPAQVWHARRLADDAAGVPEGSVSTNQMIGTMDIPVPQAPATNSDFSWELVDGNYVLTNVKTVSATSSHTFKIAIRDLLPMDIVDMSTCDEITARVDVTTNQGNLIYRESNPIDAQVDTIAKINSAYKNGEVIENYYNNMVPDRLLENLPQENTNPEDYIFVRWTSYHSRTNNQPFSLKIDDVISDAYDADNQTVTKGIFLGSTNFNGQVLDSNTFKSQISEYDTTSFDGVYDGNTIYMWTAYRKDAFEIPSATEQEKVYRFNNHITWTLLEADETREGDVRKETKAEASTTVIYAPILWQRPLGRFGVDKWTESIRNKDWLYGYALNRLDMGEQADMEFVVRTTGYGYPWTSDETRGLTREQMGDEHVILETDPDTFGRLGWKQVTEDFQTFFNFEETPLTHEDFQFKSLEITVPHKMSYGKNAAGRFDYIVDENLPNPDLHVEYKLEGSDEWISAATVSWGIGGRGVMRFEKLGEGIAVDGRKIIFPQNVTDVRHTFVSNVSGGVTATKCDLAMIRWDVYPVISLKPSERIKGIVEDLLEENETPSTKFKNDVRMEVYGWVKGDDETMVVNNDFDYSRATLEAATYGVWLEKSVSYNPESKDKGGDNDILRQQMTLHYKGVVTEQSSLKNIADYKAAVATGVIPAETSGVFYDLLPENVVPVLSSVKLREKDVITNMYTVPNYNGTNRMLLVVEADLTPVPVFDAKSMPGYADQPQITFDAIYSWRDLENAEDENVMNYMAFESTVDNLHDGTLGTLDGRTGEPDNPLGGENDFTPDMPIDISNALTNLDPNTDENRFVYGKAETAVNVVTYTASNLNKMVSDDLVGIWTQGLDGMEQVTVYEGHGYTYRLQVSSSVKATKEIVIYDSLENYSPDPTDVNKRADAEHVAERKDWLGDWEGKGQWRGTLNAVDLHELVAAGVAPVLYYCDNATGPEFPYGDDDSSNNQWAGMGVFNLENTAIWKHAELDANGMWTVPAGMNVTGIAVDASLDTEGTDFILEPDQSFSVYLKMIAPDDNYDENTFNAKGAYARTSNVGKPEIDWEAAVDPENNMYAFNNTYLRHRQSDETGENWNEDLRVIYNDYTRVGIVPEIITVEKAWDDKDNNDGLRPESVEITVMRKLLGVAGDPTPVLDGAGNPIKAVLSDENGWKAAFRQMEVVDVNGTRYVYSFMESDVEGYESKLEFIASNKFRLINIHPIEQVEISGEKSWDDNDNALGMRPASITLNLYRNGQYVDSKTVYPDAEGNWKYSFGELDKYAPGGIEYNYTVEEEYVPKYTFDASDLDLLVNKYYPFGNLEVRKIVVGSNDAEKEFEFTLKLFAENSNEALAGSYNYKILELQQSGVWTEVRTGKIANSGKFSLKANQRIVIEDVPSESEYLVEENSSAGFAITSVKANGLIEAGRTQQSVFTNTYSASGSFEPQAKKLLTGRELHDRQFRFELIDQATGQVISTSRSGMPEEGKGGNGDPITSEADILFDEIFYTQADHGKTFIYEVKEIVEDKAGYVYDERNHIIRVQVTDNGDGTMKAEPKFEVDGEQTDGLVFKNEYAASGKLKLDATKVLVGGTLGEGDYTFELFKYDAENKVVGQSLGTAKNAADGSITFDELTFIQDDVSLNDDEPATYVYLMREHPGNNEMIDYAKNEIIVTVRVYDNGDSTLSFVVDNQEIIIPDDTCTECGGVGYVKDTSHIQGNQYNPYNGMTLSPVIIIANGMWQDWSFSSDAFEVTLCSACNGFAVNDQGVICSECEGSGFDKDSVLKVLNFVDFVPDEDVYQTRPGSQDGRKYWVGKCDGSTYAFQTNIEYLKGSNVECGICLGDGKMDVTPIVNGNVAGRVFENKVKGLDGLRAAKLLDGQTPENGAFQFVLKDGNTIVSGPVSTVNGVIVFDEINNLTAGVHYYTIEEVVPENAQNGSIIYDTNRFEVEVTAANENNRVVITDVKYPNDEIPVFRNTTANGNLKISKTLVSSYNGHQGQDFTFTVILRDTNGNLLSGIYKTDAGYSFAVTNGVATFRLEGGESVTLEDLPHGTTYTITETVVSGFNVSAMGASGTIVRDETAEAKFTNTYSASGNVKFEGTKTLIGRDLTEDDEFTFEILENGSLIGRGSSDENGTIDYPVIKYTDEDVGTHTYIVRESSRNGRGITVDEREYTVTVTVTDNGDGTLTIRTSGNADELDFENIYEAEGAVTFKGEKKLNGRQMTKDDIFTFEVKEGDEVIATVENDETGKISYPTIRYTLDDVGTHTYTVAETGMGSNGISLDTRSYTVKVTVSDHGDGTLKIETSSNAEALNFVNLYEASGKVKFEGTKTLTGRELTAGDVFEFQIQENGEVIATATNDATGKINYPTISYTAADIGTHTYTVIESSTDGNGIKVDTRWYTVTVEVIDNGDGTLDVEVTEGSITGLDFENRYETKGEVTFEGKKSIEGRELTAGDVFEFQIQENGKVIATATNDATGKINYPTISYTAADIGTHTYTVIESSTDGNGIKVDTRRYTVTVEVIDNGDGTLKAEASDNADDLDFVNIYDAQITLTLHAFKTVDGEEPTDRQVFDFVCIGESERAGEMLTAQNENGNIVFGPLSFSLEDVGKTFAYTVYEVTESSEYMITDDAVYTVYLTVGDRGDGTLYVDHVIERDGEPANTVIFDNHVVAPLIISKRVDGVQTDKTFNMTVNFFDKEGNKLTDAFTYTGDAEGTIVSGGSIALGHDQSVIIHGLQIGTQYTVVEESGLAYTTTVNGEDGRESSDEIVAGGNRVDFVNTMKLTSFSVTKVWEDGRSDDIRLTIYANGVKMDPQPEYVRQNDQYIFTNLPMYDDQEEFIVYTAKEKGIEGYITIYYNIDPYKDVTSQVHDGGTIVNRPERALSFKIQKIWKNMDGQTPPPIELKLYCNGVEMDIPTAKPNRNGWYQYYDLPTIVNGIPAVYTVVEVPLGGYATYYEDSNGYRTEYGVNGGKIINYKLPETGDHQSLAVWMLMLGTSLTIMLLRMKRKKKSEQ